MRLELDEQLYRSYTLCQLLAFLDVVAALNELQLEGLKAYDTITQLAGSCVAVNQGYGVFVVF